MQLEVLHLLAQYDSHVALEETGLAPHSGQHLRDAPSSELMNLPAQRSRSRRIEIAPAEIYDRR
jgi:hypothetical protein